MKKPDGYRQTAKSGLTGILPCMHTFTLMIKHEETFCPRCRASFECKVGSLLVNMLIISSIMIHFRMKVIFLIKSQTAIF